MAEPTTRDQIYAEQVHQLYRLSRSAYPGTLITSSILVFALWGVISSALLGAWLCAMYALTGVRYLLYRDYLAMNRPVTETRKWVQRFVMGAGSTGLLWGVAGSALYPAASLPHQFLVIFLIGGMSLSATVVLAPVQQAFLAYMLPAMSLVTATVFAQGTPLHLFMGALMIVLLGVMLAITPALSEMMRDALRVKFDNSALVEQLSRANQELSERIASQGRTEEELRQTTQQVGALIDASPVSIIARDRDFRIVKWNAAAERIFGWNEREVLGKPVPFVPSELEDEARAMRERLLGGESINDIETVSVRKDGVRITISLSTTVVRDDAGQPTGFFSIATDITEKKRAERRSQMGHTVTRLLAESRSIEEALPQVLRTVCEAGGWSYGQRWALNRPANLLHCAETWCAADHRLEEFEAFNRSRMQTPGNGRGLLHRVWDSNNPIWLEDLEEEKQMQRAPMALKAGLRSAFALPILVGDGLYGVMEFFGREARRLDHELVEIVRTIGSQVGQFMARKNAEQNLRFVASHDPLTGLFNRSMFNERLQQALAQAGRFERSLALLFIDLDGFKGVNDTLGHNAGDQLLAELATRLRATLREGDVIGRMGGDEFVVLIEEFGDAGQVAEVAKKVLETVSRSFQLQGGDFEVTASVGASLYPADGKDAQTLLKNADLAMYLVKQQGKNGFRFYAPQMNVHLVERLSLESSLRRALERGELLLLYQPRVGVREGQVSGVEALLRWQHPSQGMINPAEFLPLAEDAGLMSAVWEWAIHTACRQMRAWRDQGLPLLRMAVNLSPRQLSQDGLIPVVREALHRHGMDPARLELEVREEMVLRNPERAIRLLGQFKELGVRLVVDDFGTGYSSLNYLKRLPIDTVKIDRSLIRELPRDADSAALSRAVIAMAHSLGISVTAEGVETREQWEFLRELGCEEMQGNYFSAPVPPEIVASIVRQPVTPGSRASVQPLRPRRADNGADFE